MRELVAADAEIGEVARFDAGAVDLDDTGDHDQRVLVVGTERAGRGAGTEIEVDAGMVGVTARRGRGPVEVADQDGRDCALEVELRQLVVVLERRSVVAGRRRLRDPELDALDRSPIAARSLLGVRDAATGGHEVELAGSDHLLGAERIAMQRLPFEQPGDGLEADVRVRGNVEAMRLVDVGRPHVVEEAPRPDGASTAAWERPTNAEGADLALAALRDLDARASSDRRWSRRPERRRRW